MRSGLFWKLFLLQMLAAAAVLAGALFVTRVYSVRHFAEYLEDMGLKRIPLALDIQEIRPGEAILVAQLRIAGFVVPIGPDSLLRQYAVHAPAPVNTQGDAAAGRMPGFIDAGMRPRPARRSPFST